ncbi:MAG: hypothetical protein N3D11_02920 [Candidatus Sumerlaeia bacterium]|nr:hypothetical protein [Candidatus Sumerlaeia bacterium]
MRSKAMIRNTLVGLVMTAAAGASASFDRPIKVEHREEKQMKYYDTKFARGVRAIFYNFRDGALGLINNGFQLAEGLGAAGLIAGGKITVFASDLVGFVDDNIFTRPILRGLFSDMLEIWAYDFYRSAKGMMLMSHELDDIAIVVDRDEYINDDCIFKTRLYLRPWVVLIVPTTLIADGLIRPAGSLAKMFSIRRFTDMEIPDVPDQLDAYGLRLIWKSYNWKFFLPIPQEDEPDLRIYTEEEITGIKAPGPMRRPIE